MAYFPRLILLCFVFFFGNVNAAVDKVEQYRCGWQLVSYMYTGSSIVSACSQSAAAMSPIYVYKEAVLRNPLIPNEWNVSFTYNNGNSTEHGWVAVKEFVCPPNSSSSSGSGCTCSTGYTEHSGACQPPPPDCSENQELDDETNTCVCKHGPAGAFSVSGDVMTGCNDGCTIYVTSGSYSKSTNKTYGSWNQNGNTCSPSPDSPGVDSPDSPGGQDAGKCPTGQCPGTFNGQFMCVPCKGKESSDSSSSENTTETPNGASAPSGSTSQSQSGSKSTECEGGVCITKETVVTRNPDGSTTENQKETTESISDYCAKNPKASICKTEDAGQWSGACSGGFECKGDPVQCAQAREVAQLRCTFEVSPDDPLAVSGGRAMNDQLTPSGHPGAPGSGLTVDVMGKIEETPVFGSSGNCISDRTFSVIGMSLTLPFASMCPYFNMIGNVFLSCCYLVAGFIVFRR